MNLKQSSHKRPKKKKEARITSSDDDEIDFWPSLIGAGISLFSGMSNRNQANQSYGRAYNPYDIDELREEQAGAQGLYEDMAGYGQESMGFGKEMYQQGQELYGQGQSFFDIGSEQNQLMRKSVMDDSMNQIGLQNTLAQRGPGGGNTGISRANTSSNILQGQGQAQQNFLQGYQQNMGIGQGLLGMGMGQQRAGMSTFGAGVGQIGSSAQGQAGLAENIQQARISNNEMQNQRWMDQGNQQSQNATNLFGMASDIFSNLF